MKQDKIENATFQNNGRGRSNKFSNFMFILADKTIPNFWIVAREESKWIYRKNEQNNKNEGEKHNETKKKRKIFISSQYVIRELEFQ